MDLRIALRTDRPWVRARTRAADPRITPPGTGGRGGGDRREGIGERPGRAERERATNWGPWEWVALHLERAASLASPGGRRRAGSSDASAAPAATWGPSRKTTACLIALPSAAEAGRRIGREAAEGERISPPSTDRRLTRKLVDLGLGPALNPRAGLGLEPSVEVRGTLAPTDCGMRAPRQVRRARGGALAATRRRAAATRATSFLASPVPDACSEANPAERGHKARSPQNRARPDASGGGRSASESAPSVPGQAGRSSLPGRNPRPMPAGSRARGLMPRASAPRRGRLPSA